jgi:hypothetical protein
MWAVQTLKHKPTDASRLALRTKRLRDPIYRDVVAPFGCQRRDYLNSCHFSNAIDKFGVKFNRHHHSTKRATGFHALMLR